MRGVVLGVMLAVMTACGPREQGPMGPAGPDDAPLEPPTPEVLPPGACEYVQPRWLGGYDMGLSNRAQGLWTNPNVQTDAPDGANDKAENVELDRSGLARPRVGQRRLAADYPNAAQRFRAGTTYQGYGFEFASSSPGGPGTLYRRDPSTEALTPVLGMSPPPSTMRPRFADADGEFYVTTGLGVRSTEDALGSFSTVGFERVADIEVSSNGATGTVFLAPQQAVAYRAVVTRRDARGALRMSVPSGRRIFVNTSTTDTISVAVNVPLPQSARVGDRVQLYRSGQTDMDVDPGDVLYLAADYELTGGNIMAGGAGVIDRTPDVLLGQPLYTNATQEGILGQNEAPPLARDMLVFGEGARAGQLLLANTTGLESITVRFLGVPSLAVVYTVDGVGFTVPPPATTGSIAQDIENVARATVVAINAATAFNNVRGFYLSGQNDPPGIILLERIAPTNGPFTLSVSGSGTLYEPALATPLQSVPDVRPNGVYVSKPGQLYAFPRYDQNRLRIGRDDRAILRIIALRNDVFAFKDGEGIFKLTPIADGWNVEQMNQDANLLIPESVAVLDNRILAYTSRGIVAVDAYGVEELDLPVKNYTEALATLPPETVQAATFAAADSTRLCYWLWFPEAPDATVATRALLWNGRANPPAWTERTDAATGGYVSPDGFLMLGEAPRAGFTASRRTGSLDDFQGPDNDAYTVRISWPNRAEGMPGASKHYRQARLYFEKPQGSKTAPLPVTWLFTNDYAKVSPPRTNQVYGLPYSSMEPDAGYQRTSDLGIEVSFPVLRQYIVVKGVEEVVSSAAPVRMGRR